MPLPALLAARLTKRGLINAKKTGKEAAEPQEEVIAEDYDPTDDLLREAFQDKDILTAYPPRSKRLKLDELDDGRTPCPGCPNKYNVYHECQDWCWVHWNKGREPRPDVELKKELRLRKYPLPENWKEAYDPGTGRFYFWNVNTEEVSWLPPLHPKAKVSQSADVLREKLQKDMIEANIMRVKAEIQSRQAEAEESREKLNKDRGVDRRKDKREEYNRGRLKRKDNDLDPMDPASYSDIPRGDWSAGLAKENEAKTGVDITASGPLYQMRPYPSPGAVLRANNAHKDRK